MSLPSADTVALLQDLVKIESVNPSLSPRGSGEQRVAEYLERFCRDRNLPYELQHVVDGRSNFLTWISGKDPSRRLLFVAHMDTVPTDNWASDPFSPELKHNRLYGRGSCDTKGSLSAMMIALSTLGDHQPNATIVVAASIDEEYRKIGARAIALSGKSYDAAVVGEPTELELVVAHKGSVRWQIEVQGVPAHTSKPHLGVNAISGMAKVILALNEHGENLASRIQPLVSPPTLTVSLIEGGLELTTVPPSCRIWVDRRLVPGERPEQALAEVENILQGLRDREDIKVRSLLPALEDPAPDSAESSKIASVAAQACAKVAGTGKYIGVPYGTDASQLSLAGIPCIVLGPGSIDRAHTNNEFIELDQLERSVEIYRRIMLSY
ncbi:MAG: M20 family peptidase [Mesorhizobium sp.]|uniref:M20 family metallopeptidase n=1 Tax=Mesorhizobium sp. TaxID=1871066 RepID=UPI000FE9D180|nr:M20 family metallopeptidase [Mesorhizobium sp.]RWP16104.1 MAG: M20 family peptidase [Mesorhizobium sp.]